MARPTRTSEHERLFSALDCTPRWRERLPDIKIPALVVHGRRDLFFPPGNGEAIARAILEARLPILGPRVGNR